MITIKQEIFEDDLDDEPFKTEDNKNSDETYTPTKPKKADTSTCQTCNATFKSKLARIKHYKVHPNPSNEKIEPPSPTKEKTWKCRKCNEAFRTKRLLATHRKKHRNLEEVKEFEVLGYPGQYNYKFDKKAKNFVCDTCGSTHKTQDDANKHTEEQHERALTCANCGKTFQKIYQFAIHTYEHSEDKVFRCPICEFDTQARALLSYHINRTHLQRFKYKCEQCCRGFFDITFFEEHKNEHLGVKPFECVVCRKAFSYSKYLLQHQSRNHRVEIETDVGPYACKVCSKVFQKQVSLQKHFTVLHDGTRGPREKKRLCDICGKGFAETDKLRMHYRIHTGVKPYSCSYCEKSFSKRDYLVMHERIHTGEKPYECEHCGKCFNQTASLRIHVRSHTGERPYVCRLCQTGFTCKGAMDLHLKTCSGCAY